MSFAAVSLGSQSDTGARSAHTCTIFRAPADDALILVSVLATDNAGTVVEPTGVEGAGLTFSLVTSSITFSTIASGVRNLSAWRGMGSSLASSVVTATFPNATAGAAMLVTEFTGTATGSNGANAIAQSATSRVDNASNLTAIAPTAMSTDNAWFIAFSSDRSAAVDALSGNYTVLDSSGFGAPDSTVGSAWTTLSTGTIVGTSGGATRDRAATMIELVLATAAAPAAAQAYRRQVRLPPVPSGATGPLADWCRLAARQLNQEGYVSLFSGANPNTSGFTGVPGDLLVNIGSASTTSRLWIMGGGVTSLDTNDWHPVRIA